MYQDRFDDSEWTHACRFSVGGDSDEDYALHLRTMKEVASLAEASKKRLAIVICQEPGFPAPDSSWRKKVAEMTASPSFRPVHCAIVTSNPLVRGAVTALNWLRKREYSEAIFGDIESALAWLEASRCHSLPTLRQTVQGWGSRSSRTGVEDRMRSVAARCANLVERGNERQPRRPD